MEITQSKIDELNKSNNILIKCEMVRSIFLRAHNSKELSEYFNNETLNNLFSNIIVCRNEESLKKHFLKTLDPQDRKNISYFDIPEAFTVIADNKIYIKETAKIDVIVHELIHFISNKKNNGSGIKDLAQLYYNNQKKLDTNKVLEIDSLNEAITHFITQLLIPEINVNDGYNYGASIIQKYYNMCKELNEKPNRVFDSYFKGNINAFDSIIKDFGIYWDNLLSSINKKRFMAYYKEGSDKVFNEEEISNILNEIKNNYEIKNAKNLTNYNVARENYSRQEQNRLLEISREKSQSKEGGKYL